MVPMIYEELSREESIETEYLALGAWIGDKPIAAIVADPEERGDLNILSVWTLIGRLSFFVFGLYNNYHYTNDH